MSRLRRAAVRVRWRFRLTLICLALLPPAVVNAAEPPLPERKATSASSSSRESGSPRSSAKKDGPLAPAERPSLAWTKIEIDAGKKECAALLGKLPIEYVPLEPIREGDCGAPAPILVKSIGENPAVSIMPPATLRCPMAAALHSWLTEIVQPEARALFSSPVMSVRNAADYHCRNRYGKTGGKLSEHALANALDISAFTLQSATTVALRTAWPRIPDLVATPPKGIPPLPDRNPQMLAAALAAEKRLDEAMGRKGPKLTNLAYRQAERSQNAEAVSLVRVTGEQILEVMKARSEPQPLPATPPAATPEKPLEPPLKTSPDAAAQFMVRIHTGACAFFGTVLGPEANAAHKSHFHFDGIERRSSYCQ